MTTMGSKQIFHVGDRALYQRVGQEVEVEIIEERGPIGVNGRHLVRIRMPRIANEPIELEIAEAYLRPVTGAA